MYIIDYEMIVKVLIAFDSNFKILRKKIGQNLAKSKKRTTFAPLFAQVVELVDTPA